MTSPAPVVLVAEDEGAVGAVVKRCLQYEGYTVLTAADGLSALAVLQSLPAPVDLLVADAYARANRGRPAARARKLGFVRQVLFITGYDSHPNPSRLRALYS